MIFEAPLREENAIIRTCSARYIDLEVGRFALEEFSAAEFADEFPDRARRLCSRTERWMSILRYSHSGRTFFSSRGKHRQTITRIDDRDGFESFQHQQILIARHDGVCLGSERSRENAIVVGIATDRLRQRRGFHHIGIGAHGTDHLARLGRSQPGFAPQLLFQFSEDVGRCDNLRALQALLVEARADTVRHERREEDVRIENNPHEIALKTSSSV